MRAEITSCVKIFRARSRTRLFVADLRTYGNESSYHDSVDHREIATGFQNQNCHATARRGGRYARQQSGSLARKI